MKQNGSPFTAFTETEMHELGSPNDRFEAFVIRERGYFDALNTGIAWKGPRWNVSDWLFHRGVETDLVFTTRPNGVPINVSVPAPKIPLPEPFSDLCKAMAVYLQRTRNLGFAAVRVYVDDCRRLYNCAYGRNEISPIDLTSWHFDETVRHLQASKSSAIYDTACRLQAVAEIIDRYRLTNLPLQFVHGIAPKSKYLRYVSMTDPEREEKLRRDDEKLPSKEALEAFAHCTNNPINDDEEILLRTIDLFVAMGQRANEICCIPFDCWVERPVKDEHGRLTIDGHGEPIVEVGIRYYPEKHFVSRVHWLADHDIPLARRAVNRLKSLTQECRKVAKWQELNPGRLWKFARNDELHEDDLIQILCFANRRNLYLYLAERNNVKPCTEVADGARKARYYRAGDVEDLLLTKLGDHVVLKENSIGGTKIVLRTSDTLCIRFDGAFRFVRSANVFKVLPRAVSNAEINSALGAVDKNESVFDRRNITEADGTKIRLTSHQPRHWRNTLYAMAGMSNVQQALAMGRNSLSQNIAYQHTSIRERTESHHDFLGFSSMREKMTYMHQGIRDQHIVGNLTSTYHHVKATEGLQLAEQFLMTHAQAMHVTPFGACGHDFSQMPCPKHIQCWNDCSHLHRTTSPGEDERLRSQIQAHEKILASLHKNGEAEFGADVWVRDLEKKLGNMKMALKLVPTSHPVQVFPQGKSIYAREVKRKGSSVNED